MKRKKIIFSIFVRLTALAIVVFFAFLAGYLGRFYHDNRAKSYEEVFGEPYPKSPPEEEELMIPNDGFINNEILAVEMAKLYVAHHLGRDVVRQQSPFRAELSEGVWTVVGNTTPSLLRFQLQSTGSRVRLEFDKKTGCIMKFVPFE